MIIEIGAIGSQLPDIGQVSKGAADLLKRVLDDSSSVNLEWDEGVPELHWQINWTSENSVWAIIVPPGSHEFEDQWFLSLSPGERGDDSSMLLCIVATIVSAENINGIIFDEIGLIGGGMLEPSSVRRRLEAAGPSSPAASVAALR